MEKVKQFFHRLSHRIHDPIHRGSYEGWEHKALHWAHDILRAGPQCVLLIGIGDSSSTSQEAETTSTTVSGVGGGASNASETAGTGNLAPTLSASGSDNTVTATVEETDPGIVAGLEAAEGDNTQLAGEAIEGVEGIAAQEGQLAQNQTASPLQQYLPYVLVAGAVIVLVFIFGKKA